MGVLTLEVGATLEVEATLEVGIFHRGGGTSEVGDFRGGASFPLSMIS